MSNETYDIVDDPTLKRYVRVLSGYSDSEDELPEHDLESIIGATKLELKLRGNSDQWFSDDGLGLMLLGYTLINAKSQVENIVIEEYQLGNERVRTRNASPEQNQQLNRWAELVNVGKQASTTFKPNKQMMRSTGDFIGRQSIRDTGTRY